MLMKFSLSLIFQVCEIFYLEHLSDQQRYNVIWIYLYLNKLKFISDNFHI